MDPKETRSIYLNLKTVNVNTRGTGYRRRKTKEKSSLFGLRRNEVRFVEGEETRPLDDCGHGRPVNLQKWFYQKRNTVYNRGF